MQRERAVQVTVVEYINEFFTQYSRRAYGKTVAGNASKGADVFMGMLKLVLSRGGRDELRIALHCFKDQLTAAINSPPSVRQQQVEEVFALLSALIDAAERLRQFSPVKEQLSAAVLEEVRFRLYRIIVGDGFCEDVLLRRRALDISFTAMMREADEAERARARINKLSCTGASPAPAAAAAASATTTTASSGALVLASHYHHHQATAAGTGAVHAGGDAAAKGPGRLRGSLQRKAAALGGPDYSSWEGLWASLGNMAPKRMLPLLQAVMTDLYLGRLMPGTPGAAAAAASQATASASSSSSSSSCGAAATPRGGSALPKQPPQQQQVEAATHVQQPQSQSQPQQGEAALVSTSSQDHNISSSAASSPNSSAARDAAAGLLVGNGPGEVLREAAATAAADAPSTSTQPHAPQHEQQQNQPRQQQPPPPPSRFGRSSARAGHPIAAGYGASSSSGSAGTSCDSTPTAVATISTSINSSSNAAVAAGSSPKQSGSPAEGRSGTFAAFASRLSGGGSNKDKNASASAAGSNSSSSSSSVGAGSKWGGLVSGGFLGLQSTSNGSSSSIGSGRLIPRGWVQFGAQHASTQQQKGAAVGGGAAAAAVASLSVAVTPESGAGRGADTAGVEACVADAGLQQKQHQQQQLDQVAAAVEPCTPGQGLSPPSTTTAAAAVAAVAVAATNRETGMLHDNSGGSLRESEHGFDGEEPDWGSGGSSSNCCSHLKPSASAAVHCTPAAPVPVPAPTPAAAGL